MFDISAGEDKIILPFRFVSYCIPLEAFILRKLHHS